MPIATGVRRADLSSLVDLLREQHVRKIDMVAPASQFKAQDGLIVVKGVDPIITDDGVTQADGRYEPTAVFDEGVADKLGIPLAYVRKISAERPDLYDANINGWLHGRKEKRSLATLDQGTGQFGPGTLIREGIPADGRSFLLRAFRGDDGEVGIARALLSDRFARMDNLDVLLSVLDGVQAAGVQIEVDGCDLSDRRMYVRIKAPQVQALAPALLRGYRSPFSGAEGADNPTVFAGFEISNSEVGDGAFSIVPRLVVQVCNNGLKITKDAMRQVHLGARLDHGLINWSADTEQKNLDLVKAKTRDAVSTFLDVQYMERAIRQIEEKSDAPLTDAVEQVKTIGKKLLYTEEQTKGILDHFIKVGQPTAGGVMNAITSYAQTVDDADAAARLEDTALRALELAAAS